jgi:hypothetical protein
MSRMPLLCCVVLSGVLLGGCRSARERPHRSTAVGNPGDMTVSLGPAPASLDRARLSLRHVTLEDCVGGVHRLPGGTVDLLDDAPELPLPPLAAGLCGLGLEVAGALVVEGSLADGRPLRAELDLGALELGLDERLELRVPEGEVGPSLDLVLGAEGWLDPDWIPAGERVDVVPGDGLHGALVDRLRDGARLVDHQTETTVAQATDEPAPTQPDALVAVGAGGQLRLSFDGGASWAVDLRTGDGEEALDLEAVIAVPDHPLGPQAVAVGGRTEFRAVSITVGPEATEAPDLDREGLRAGTWTGQQFVVVGEQGAVSRSSDGLTWDEDPLLGDCDLLAVHSDGDSVLAAGVQGCAWASEDGGMAWTPLPELSDTALRLVRWEAAWVVLLEDGTVHWTVDPTAGWTPLELGEEVARDLLMDDVAVRILTGSSVLSTDDLTAVWDADGPGPELRQWVGAGERLLALTEDGTIVAAAPGAVDAPLAWETVGTAPRATSGALPYAFALWPR